MRGEGACASSRGSFKTIEVVFRRTSVKGKLCPRSFIHPMIGLSKRCLGDRMPEHRGFCGCRQPWKPGVYCFSGGWTYFASIFGSHWDLVSFRPMGRDESIESARGLESAS